MIVRKLFELFDRLLGSQWGCPHRPLSWLAGRLMERGNARMNELAIEALDVQPGDAVLEIGFGPGAALERIAGLVGDGFVAGIDPSRAMVRQGSRRLKRRIAEGRAELRQGRSSKMPYPDARFDRVLSVNTIYFWEQPRADLSEVRRVTKPGGRFVLVFRATADDSEALAVHGMPQPTLVDKVRDWMREAGFTDLSVRTREAPFGPVRVTAVALIGSAVDG